MLLALPLWLALALRLPVPTRAAPALDQRSSTTLADGRSYQSGAVSSTLRWQSSGVLVHGGCAAEVGIRDCYTMSLSASGDLQTTSASSSSKRSTTLDDLAASDDDDLDAYDRAYPDFETAMYGGEAELVEKRQLVLRNCSDGGGGPPPSPRQRIELLTWPGAAAGSVWRYEWKSRTSDTSTSSHFFHMWQLLRRDACGGPVVTLDLKGGQAAINDPLRGCSYCRSVPASSWTDRTISHTLLVKYGLSGSLRYAAHDAGLGLAAPPLLEYAAKGDMGAKSSLKVGSYRAAVEGMREVTTWVGDLSATRLL
ncbi:hypothetical protein JCM10207_006632 [Rhodosporidiobolus poonsookiae]